MPAAINQVAAIGALRGAALGDSLGLPYEGLSAKRGQRLMPFPLRQRLLFGRGSLSDDAVQSALALQALIAHPDSPVAFRADLARRLRLWFLSIPPGIGLATVKACGRLCLGFGAKRSGVPSAGNGAAMRSAVLGAAQSDDPEARQTYVGASARITHTHPLGVAGAQLIALAASLSATGRLEAFDDEAAIIAPDWPWSEAWRDRGPSGYVVQSVNAVIRVWREHPTDLGGAIWSAVELGGDTDTVASMVGGIVGASPACGPAPEGWLRYSGWPQPTEFQGIVDGSGARTPYLRLAAHHVAVLPVIPAFGFRRLLPPY